MRATRVRQKAGREERRERRKGRGRRGERRAGTGSAEGHTPCWESSRGYPGVLKQEAGAGVSLAASLWREAQGSKQNLLEGPAHLTSSHKITSLCQHHCSTPVVLLQQRQQRVGRGVWGAELQNQLLCIREQTPPGEQTAAWLPGSPSSRDCRQRERVQQLLRDCGHKSWVVCRT